MNVRRGREGLVVGAAGRRDGIEVVGAVQLVGRALAVARRREAARSGRAGAVRADIVTGRERSEHGLDALIRRLEQGDAVLGLGSRSDDDRHDRAVVGRRRRRAAEVESRVVARSLLEGAGRRTCAAAVEEHLGGVGRSLRTVLESAFFLKPIEGRESTRTDARGPSSKCT